ncbi:MAG: ABC transporter ATP-binding protein [Clostridia bacterium]|nr:ABC transporter ATP-binding protein [Clostridia bacterium]
MSIIEVNNLTKLYSGGKVRGIENMNFTVDEGELFGFIGPNGAGKSTTIRILMNILKPTSGTARIFDLDCKTHSRIIKRDVGYMPSEVRFYPGASVKELLNYACRLRGSAKGCWRELADDFHLDAQKKFGELSIGNRRKLSIINAMMHKPRLLILDEPTGGLDPLMQEKFFEKLLECRKNGATVFFSSHNLNEVQKYCSRVALVKNGHIEMMPDLANLPMHSIELTTSSDTGQLFDKIRAVGIHKSGSSIRFMLPGVDLSTLLSLLAGMNISDVVITKPSLEQVFHKIYQGEEKSK